MRREVPSGDRPPPRPTRLMSAAPCNLERSIDGDVEVKTQTMLAILIALLLTACGGGTGSDADSAGEAAPEPSAPEADTDSGTSSEDGELCVDMGPQTPRDISSTAGENTTTFPLAPAPEEMNLCNLHTHTNAEHQGPASASSSTTRIMAGSPATRARSFPRPSWPMRRALSGP